MRPDQQDNRVEDQDRSDEVPADAALDITRDGMTSRTDGRTSRAEDRETFDYADGGDDVFDPTSRDDEEGEVM